MVYIICGMIGILTAFFGSLMGLGGGVILIPILLFLHQYVSGFAWATPQMIVGISLVVMVFTALSSSIAYMKKGRIDFRTGWVLLSGSIPGGVFGSWLNQFIQVDYFSLYFGMLTILISMLFFLKRKEPPKIQTTTNQSMRSFEVDGYTYHYHVHKWLAFFLSFAVGMLSGLFGIGGGSIMVPAMILLFAIPAHIATATSMFMILFISIISASTHIALGHIPWDYVFFFVPGAYLGAKLGAYINQTLSGKALERLLRFILILIGVRLIVEGLG